jgi:hypothetical protein
VATVDWVAPCLIVERRIGGMEEQAVDFLEWFLLHGFLTVFNQIAV